MLTKTISFNITSRQDLVSLKDELTAFIAAIDTILAHVDETHSQTASPVARGGRMVEVADTVYTILLSSDNGKMHRNIILEKLEADGVPIGGKDRQRKLAALSSALSKDTRFKSMGRSTGLWCIDQEHVNRVDKLNGQSALTVHTLNPTGVAGPFLE